MPTTKTFSRIRKVSAKRRRQLPARKECKRIVFERCKGLCEMGPMRNVFIEITSENGCWIVREGGTLLNAANIAPQCTGLCEDPHEILSQGQGGDPNDPANVLGGCRNCHNFAHRFPNIAAHLGLKKFRNKSVEQGDGAEVKT